MRRIEGDVNEERLVLVTRDEVHGLRGDQVGGVAGDAHPRVVLPEIRLATAVGVAPVVVIAALEAEEVLESMGGGALRGFVAKVPLSHECRGVAAVGEEARERRRRRVERVGTGLHPLTVG